MSAAAPGRRGGTWSRVIGGIRSVLLGSPAPAAAPTGAAAIPEGLWRDDFARIDRACRRFVQVAAGREDLAATLEVLTSTREHAWQVCRQAAAVDPRPVAEVPADPDLAALHRALSRAAGRCAQAAQAAVMLVRSDDGSPQAAERAARQAADLVAGATLPGPRPPTT